MQRLHVQVRPLRPPRGDQVVYLVAEQRFGEDLILGVRLRAVIGALAHY